MLESGRFPIASSVFMSLNLSRKRSGGSIRARYVPHGRPGPVRKIVPALHFLSLAGTVKRSSNFFSVDAGRAGGVSLPF
jgi:hypothetical protein